MRVPTRILSRAVRRLGPVVFCLVLAAAGRPSAQSKPVILEAIAISRQGDAVVVDIIADGPLPIPATGRVDSPPRYFLDFPGVIAGTRGAAPGPGVLKRVRVALNTKSPLVTRVVLDLTDQPPVQIQGDESGRGRIRLILGKPETGAPTPADRTALREARRDPLIPIPPDPVTPPATDPLPAKLGEPIPTVPPLPSGTAGSEPLAPRPAPSADLPPPAIYPVKSGSPGPTPSPDEIERYRNAIEGPLNRIRALRPLLTEIDQRGARPPEGRAEARGEVSAAIRALAAVHPPDSLKPVHDLLLRAASFSMMAATLRADAGTRADPTDIRNASSAAAGALLLLDRVCIELGCTDEPRRN